MKLHHTRKLLVICVSTGSLALFGCTQTPTSTAQTGTPSPITQTSPATTPTSEKSPDVVYVPTPEVVVAKMLELGKVDKDDVLYDLGSGDGRIVITAAQNLGARGVGVEVQSQLIKEAQENAEKAGVSDRVQFLQQDLFTTDLSKATVVTLYLLPSLNEKLRPKLFKELKPGTLVVSHDFDMGDWKPEQVVTVQGPQREHQVYVWRIPETVPENLR